MRPERTLWVVLALLSLPLASAASSVSGTLDGSGLDLPADATLAFTSRAAWFPDSSAFGTVTLHARDLVLHVFDENITDVTVENPVDDLHLLVPHATAPDEQVYTFPEATVTLVGGTAEGYVGAHLADTGTASVRALSLATVTPRASGHVGNNVAGGEDFPATITFRADETMPHVLLDGPGTFVYQGQGALKVVGPEVVVHSSGQERMRVTTGVERNDELPSREVRQRWAYVTFASGTFHIETRGTIQAMARGAEAAWDGVAQMADARGALEAGGTRYDAASDERVTILSGVLEASLAPTGAPHAPRLGADLRGEILATNLVRSVPASGQAWYASTTLWVLVLGACVAGGGVTGILVHRHRTRMDAAFSVEEMAQFADLAAESENFPEALVWVDSAIRLAPRSARLHEDRGFFLAELGQVDEALASYEKAAHLSGSGEPFLAAARLVLESGGEPDRARAYAVSALQRTPALVQDLDDELLALLRGDPRSRLVHDEARRRAAQGD